MSSTDSLSTQTNLDGKIHDTIFKRFYLLISCLCCSSKDSYAEEMRRSSGGYTGTGYGGRREGRSYSSSDSLDDLGVYNCCARICMTYQELLYCSSYVIAISFVFRYSYKGGNATNILFWFCLSTLYFYIETQ